MCFGYVQLAHCLHVKFDFCTEPGLPVTPFVLPDINIPHQPTILESNGGKFFMPFLSFDSLKDFAFERARGILMLASFFFIFPLSRSRFSPFSWSSSPGSICSNFVFLMKLKGKLNKLNVLQCFP